MTGPIKRIATDVAGYSLVLAGIAFGWLPGPGGIPLVLAGLGLLSINNQWAARLRDWLIRNGATFLRQLFPENRVVQILYDIASLLLLALASVQVWRHAALWETSLAIALFCIALVMAAMNRGRGSRVKNRLHKH